MSPTIPILSALLLSLISGSTEGGQRTDPPLRQTLQYWYKIYKEYSEEVTLGYCLAGYLLNINSGSSTQNCSNTILVEATRSQRDLFSRNVTAENAVTPAPFGETQKGKHLREQRSTISKSINDPDEHRVNRVASRSKIIQRRKRWTTNKTERAVRTVSSNYTERNREIDENERIASMVDYYARRRRRTLSIVPELLREAPRDSHEFSSRGTSSHAVNPTPNPENDDKVDFGSTDLGEENSHRKVLRSLTSHRDSVAEDAFASRTFSLKVTSGGSPGSQRFPFRSYSSSEKRDSRVDEMLSDPWTPRKDHGIEGDPAGRRDPLNNDGSSSTPSRSQFRRVNADSEYPRMNVVNLMDSEGNSSCNSTINSKTPRRKPEELSRDSLLSPHGGSAIAERSFLESPGSGGEEAVKRNAALMQFKMVSGSDTKKRDSRRPREEESSRDGRDVSMAIHPFFLSEFRRSHQQTLHENHGFSPVPTVPRKSRQDDDLVRTRRSTPSLYNSLSNVGRFTGDYEGSTSQSVQHSKLIPLQTSQNPNLLSEKPLIKPGVRSLIIAVFRTLGMFVQAGRRVIDVMQTNKAIICTREYLWKKFVKWIEAENWKASLDNEKLDKNPEKLGYSNLRYSKSLNGKRKKRADISFDDSIKRKIHDITV